MQQPDSLPTDEPIVVVHTVRSSAEAMVVRGLLEGAGIASPELGMGSGSPWPDFVSILRPFQEIEIYALESQVRRARQLIAEYFADVKREDGQENPQDSGGNNDDGDAGPNRP